MDTLSGAYWKVLVYVNISLVFSLSFSIYPFSFSLLYQISFCSWLKIIFYSLGSIKKVKVLIYLVQYGHPSPYSAIHRYHEVLSLFSHIDSIKTIELKKNVMLHKISLYCIIALKDVPWFLKFNTVARKTFFQTNLNCFILFYQ